jgi:hypothetical protein
MKYAGFALALLIALMASKCGRVCARRVSGRLCWSTRCRSGASAGCGLRVGAWRPRLPLIALFGSTRFLCP